jgi:hypothetical protein
MQDFPEHSWYVVIVAFNPGPKFRPCSFFCMGSQNLKSMKLKVVLKAYREIHSPIAFLKGFAPRKVQSQWFLSFSSWFISVTMDIQEIGLTSKHPFWQAWPWAKAIICKQLDSAECTFQDASAVLQTLPRGIIPLRMSIERLFFY